MNVQPHDRFSAAYSLTPEIVSSQAYAVGDDNPVHHDPRFADPWETPAAAMWRSFSPRATMR
jgi:hypothetical protein